MAFHRWGEKDFDWDGLDKAIQYIGTNLRWWRLGVRDYKEKWGCARIYLSFGWESIYSITHPGYVYVRYPKWLLWLVYNKLNGPVFTVINKFVVPFQVFLYKYYHKKAVKKWPHLTEELLCAADYPELLENLTPEWKMIQIVNQVTYDKFNKLQTEIYELEEKVNDSAAYKLKY